MDKPVSRREFDKLLKMTSQLAALVGKIGAIALKDPELMKIVNDFVRECSEDCPEN